jgi:ubiquinol-cytochrome c reductase cytochrome c1 subunit
MPGHSAFLMWAAEPHLEDASAPASWSWCSGDLHALVYMTKKSVYANKEH